MNEHTEPRKQYSFEVGFSLASKLLKPFIQIKPRKGLSSEILPKIKWYFMKTSWNQALIPVCYQYFLPDQKKNVGVISGPGMKKKEDQLPKLVSQCQNCGKIAFNFIIIAINFQAEQRKDCFYSINVKFFISDVVPLFLIIRLYAF